MENLVLLKSGNLLIINDHRNAPRIPISKEKRTEARNCGITVFVDISPVVINPNIKSGMASVNTSVSADSMMRVVAVLGCTLILRTNPTTTAEEVPPKAAPIKSEDRRDRSKMK